MPIWNFLKQMFFKRQSIAEPEPEDVPVNLERRDNASVNEVHLEDEQSASSSFIKPFFREAATLLQMGE